MSNKTKNRQSPASSTAPADVDGQRQIFTRDGKTVDGLSNFEAALGTNANNLLNSSTYSFNYLTKNRILLEAMYRTSWVVGMTVDIVADDMTQAGIQINSTMPPDDTEKLLEGLEDLAIWDSLNSTIKWSRLYGTGLGLLLIDGQDFSTPLNIDSIQPGSFKGILPMDRWQFLPSIDRRITKLGPNLGLPEFYDAYGDSINPGIGRVHYSRLIRLDAIELPHYQKMTENMWAESVIERMHDRLIAFDSTTVGAAQLVYKAYLRTWSIEDLRNLISMGGKAYDAVIKNVETVRRLQSSEGITLIDAKDKFETHAYTFSGLDSVLLQFGQQLAGATEIPLTRFFGQAPAGLNSTGESDLRNYYDGIRKKQKKHLRSPVKLILEIASRSILGIPLPDGFNYDFNSLWQLTDTEKAEIANKDASSMGDAFDKGLITKPCALKELRQQSHVSGRFSNITDEDIVDAENEPPPSELAVDEPVNPKADDAEGKK